MAEDLVLDTAIRDWVLIPLSVVMVLIGVLRYFVSKLMRSDQTPDLKIVKEGQLIIRARNLRAAANFIPARSFRARKHYYSNEEDGLLHVPKGQGQNPQAQMFSDPNMAMDMMKKNLSMIIPQTLTFAWVNFFFSGFVAAKIPFPLTQRFRGMLQNGIDLSTVDVSYVSSRSWYFLNLFGLRGLFSLILGEDNATDDTQRMMQMSGFGFDPTRSLGAEKDNLDIVQHEWALPKFEQRAEAVLKKLSSELYMMLDVDLCIWAIRKYYGNLVQSVLNMTVPNKNVLQGNFILIILSNGLGYNYICYGLLVLPQTKGLTLPSSCWVNKSRRSSLDLDDKSISYDVSLRTWPRGLTRYVWSGIAIGRIAPMTRDAVGCAGVAVGILMGAPVLGRLTRESEGVTRKTPSPSSTLLVIRREMTSFGSTIVDIPEFSCGLDASEFSSWSSTLRGRLQPPFCRQHGQTRQPRRDGISIRDIWSPSCSSHSTLGLVDWPSGRRQTSGGSAMLLVRRAGQPVGYASTPKSENDTPLGDLVDAVDVDKRLADARHRHDDFEVGEDVWAVLMLDGFSARAYIKLSARKIDPNAYCLHFPSHIRTSDVSISNIRCGSVARFQTKTIFDWISRTNPSQPWEHNEDEIAL
ncbi:ER membrane protein complex subunit 3 [Striga asiatica]|uniref:ER membrane protein complex subunit 3 n=2 Tax=Magnoliopsida TaxID=3398 RepID=A0A5A7QK93_STRAF|nr:ER membrane protein complex subunit 3 [Striga asiatica]